MPQRQAVQGRQAGQVRQLQGHAHAYTHKQPAHRQRTLARVPLVAVAASMQPLMS